MAFYYCKNAHVFIKIHVSFHYNRLKGGIYACINRHIDYCYSAFLHYE